ncbi:MAG: hypothetical protein ACYDHW_02680 [Syntrophorhabdaceae bacterium]
MSNHIGGGKFGKIANSWPFVKLSIGPNTISLRTMLQDVELKRESIQKIVVQRYFLNFRFIFQHNDPATKKEIEFWTFSPDRVRSDLKFQGYPVSD